MIELGAHPTPLRLRVVAIQNRWCVGLSWQLDWRAMSTIALWHLFAGNA